MRLREGDSGLGGVEKRGARVKLNTWADGGLNYGLLRGYNRDRVIRGFRVPGCKTRITRSNIGFSELEPN